MKPSWKSNAQRDAWRTFQRYGLGWKVKLDEFVFNTGDGEELIIPYINPKSYLEFLMKNHPEVVVGGAESTHQCLRYLEAFWFGYKQQHKTHELFFRRDDDEERPLRYTIPLLIHGDEGRGKRRTGTVGVFLESCIGIPQKTLRKACDCSPPLDQLNKFNPGRSCVQRSSLQDTAETFVTNTKNHSFLQRWPLIVIPGIVYKAYPNIIQEFHRLLAQQLRALFFEGFEGPNGRTFYGAFVGLKADMKWHTKIGELSRSYEHQGRKQALLCCHMCMAGQETMPWEDMSENPCWLTSVGQTRPWTAAPPIAWPPFDALQPEALFRIDPFHTCKLGVFRDMIGSCLFWWVEKGYFGQGGTLPSKLESAYTSFKSFCSSVRGTPALRSFTKALFMYKSRRSFPYANVKGSDATLLMRWLVLESDAFLKAPINAEDVATLSLMHKTATSGVAFFDCLYKHGLFLPRACAITVYVEGNRFVAGFCRLASLCLDQFCLFAIKPKLHMFRHLLLEIRRPLLEGASLILNPIAWNCEPNEDAIGRISTLSRRLDSRHISKRILQCYLVKVWMLHKRLKRALKGAGKKLKGSSDAGQKQKLKRFAGKNNQLDAQKRARTC